MNEVLRELCRRTKTKPNDWEVLDGPCSRSGVDYWFIHLPTDIEAYCNDDQGNIVIDCEMSE